MQKLFPNRDIHLDEEDSQTYHLEFDGIDAFELTQIGAEIIKTALCNLPIYKTSGKFWGYNHPKDQGLWNCELPGAKSSLIQLSSKDEMALIAVADMLSDSKCWHKSKVKVY